MALPRLVDPSRLRVTQNAYFSLITHIKQLLLVTFSDTTAGIGASFRTDARRRTDGGGRTDRCGSQNSYLDKWFWLQIFRISSKNETLSTRTRVMASRSSNKIFLEFQKSNAIFRWVDFIPIIEFDPSFFII